MGARWHGWRLYCRVQRRLWASLSDCREVEVAKFVLPSGRASCWRACRVGAMTKLPVRSACGRTRSGNGGDASPRTALPDCATNPGRANPPSTASNYAIESWRNWNCRRPQEWRVGMADLWRFRWAFLITRCGACCANKAFNCSATARGASVRTPSSQLSACPHIT